MNSIDRETQRYMTMVRALPVLTKEAELDLAARYQQTRDPRLAERLVTANLRNVVPLALRYRRYGLPIADLIAEGNAALMTALERFEPERGLRFATYANYWVRAEMLGHVLRSRSMVDGGRGRLRAKYFFRLRKEHARLLGLVGDHAQVHAMLAERFGISVDEVQSVLQRVERTDGSLDVRVGDRQDLTLVDTLTGDMGTHDESVDRTRRSELLRAAVREATADLSERERVLVEQRLMADPEDERTLVDIGASFGVSRERARQLESNVKEKLRRRLAKVVDQLGDSGTAAA
jgi:RNA polymerase sigma-32 factor